MPSAGPVAVRRNEYSQGNPGQQAGQQYGKVKPPGLRVLQRGRAETFELLLPEEDLEKPAAVAQIAQEVPWQRNRQEWRDHAQGEELAQAREFPGDGGDDGKGSGKNYGHQALGQHGQAKQGSYQREGAGIAFRYPREGHEHSGGEGGGHGQIRDAHLAEANPAERSGEDQRGVKSRPRSEFAA